MILIYHKIFPESPTTWWVDVDNFYRQMCELKCKKVVYLDEYDVNDKNEVVITFDGVYRNVLEYAAPILKDFGYPFELFVTSNYIGKDNSFDASEPHAVFASTEDLKELVESRGRLQWHSRTHQNLRNIKNLGEIHYELSVPEELRFLDKEGFKWFAYPHGDFDEIVIEETKKSFTGGISCIQGDDHDPFKLNRITVTNETSFKKGSIAVIIASYNYGSFLVEAIESVLRQTRPADEILIADDCSTDNTMEIALEYQKAFPNLIKYMRNEENLGIVKNFNKAVSNTTSDYICFLGADNRFRSDYIEKTAEILDSDDSIGIAYTDFALFGARAKIVYDGFPSDRKGDVKEGYYYVIEFPDFNEESKRELLEVGNFMHGSSMYKRKAFHDAGGYKEEKNQPEDYNLFLRMVKKGWAAKRVPDPILEYRQHSRNQTNIKLSSFVELIHYKERVKRLQDTIKNLEAAIRDKEATLNNIYNSHGWKALSVYYRVRDRIFPANTKRRILAKTVFKTILEPRKVFRNINKTNLRKFIHYLKTADPAILQEKIVKVIDRDRRDAEIAQSYKVADPYRRYVTKTTTSEGTLHWMREMSEKFSFRPSICLAVIMTEKNLPLLAQSVYSLMAQSYPFWHIALFCENELSEDIIRIVQPLIDENKLKIYTFTGINESLNQVNSDFLGFIRSGDILMPHALFEMVKKFHTDDDLDLVYTDEDIIEKGERTKPFFKPDWSPDLLLSMNYIGQFFLLKKKLFNKVGGFNYGTSCDGFYDLLLRVTEHTKNIGHIPLVLYSKGSESYPQAGKKVLEETLKRRGIKGEVIPLGPTGTYRVKRDIIGNPKVSIIIPTAYKKPNLFKNCLRSIVEKSTYKNYEIILIDNSHGKLSQKELEQLFPQSISYQIIRYERQFNYALVNNLAATKAEGDFLIFLNDDTEVIASDWIEAMLEHAQRQEVGVVGAKLLYSDGTIQHGGVFLVDTGGGSRHALRYFPEDDNGYYDFLKVTRNVSAVTFACVMVSKDVFFKLGGLDENLKIQCNDADFCLRAVDKGYRVVWTPFAVLYHRELVTREIIDFEDDIALFWNRWRHLLEKGDPYYNPNLTLDSDDFSLNMRPVVIEHHEPYLSSESKITCYRNASIDPDSIHNILVVKLDHIGDVILSLPAIKIIKTKFPRAHITVLIGSWAKPIIEGVPDINNILTFDFFYEKSEEGKRFLTTTETEHLHSLLRSLNFDLAIDLRRHPETREILKLTGARHTVGYCTGIDDNWLTISLEPSREIEDIAAQDRKPHITAQLCQLIQAITANNPMVEPSTIVMPTPSLDRKLNNTIKRYPHFLQADFLVGIHPAVGSIIRQWPIPYFARLSDMLTEHHNAQIVIFGAKREKDIGSQIIKQMKNRARVTSLIGEISLREFMDIVKNCHLFIGNISGPCHIAAFLGVPTLAIFGGQVLPHEWHPLGQKTMSVRISLDCAPCYKSLPKQCPYDLKCLKLLWPEKVMDAVYQLMAISGNAVL